MNNFINGVRSRIGFSKKKGRSNDSMEAGEARTEALAFSPNPDNSVLVLVEKQNIQPNSSSQDTSSRLEKEGRGASGKKAATKAQTKGAEIKSAGELTMELLRSCRQEQILALMNPGIFEEIRSRLKAIEKELLLIDHRQARINQRIQDIEPLIEEAGPPLSTASSTKTARAGTGKRKAIVFQEAEEFENSEVLAVAGSAGKGEGKSLNTYRNENKG